MDMLSNDLREPLYSELRRAADQLMPVVLDLGMGSYFAQVCSLVIDGYPRLRLSPIAAQALPPTFEGSFSLSPAGPNAQWSIRCAALAVDGENSAAVALSGMRLFRADEGAFEAMGAPDQLILVVTSGLDDGSDYVFPIVRIGATTAAVTCSMGLPPGTELPHVEVIGDRRLLRTASAQVTRCTPVYAADGAKSFLCTLAFGPAREEQRKDAHDLMTEAREVKRVLELMAMQRASARVQIPGCTPFAARARATSSDSASFELLDAVSTPSNEPLRVGFELFAVSYEMDVRSLGTEAGVLTTSLPLVLRRKRRHRSESRTNVSLKERVELRYRNPVSGWVSAQAVERVSFQGLSFRASAAGDVLWPGMPLEQAQLVWRDRTITLGDVVLDKLSSLEGSQVCDVLFGNSRLADDTDMIELLAVLAHPDVRAHDGEAFERLHEAYLRAGLFGPHMGRNLEPILDEVRVVWRKLHDGAREMVRTFVHEPAHAQGQEVDGAVTVLRAWEHGWVLQHFVDVSADLQGTTAKLQFAYLDHLVPRPDGRYLVFFVKDDNHIMNAYLKRFFQTTGTPEALTCSTVELFIGRNGGAATLELPDDMRLVPCTPDDQITVSNAAHRAFGAHAAAAASLVPGEIDLPDSSARFARAGLERSRDCVLLLRGDRIAYALLEEKASPGVNLTWMLNAVWILPVHPGADDDGRALEAALRVVRHRPAQTATGERFLNLPPGLPLETLHAAGFEREASLNFYVLNRAGLHRLFHYTAVRYGEIEALVQKRQSRRSRRGENEA